jgi:hypothetical protein
VDAAGRAAAAKRDAEEAHKNNQIEVTRKAADRAKLAHKTAIDAERQIAEALADLKQISEEIVHKVDAALEEQDFPTQPVILPLPPPSPPALEEEEEDEDQPPLPPIPPKKPTPLMPTIVEEEEEEEEEKPPPSQPIPPQKPTLVIPPTTIEEEDEEDQQLILDPIPFLVRPQEQQPKQQLTVQIPSVLIEEEDNDEPLTPVPDFDLPSLPQALALVAGPAAASPRPVFSSYPPQYLNKLLGMTREQLSDPKYQWASFIYDRVYQRFYMQMTGGVTHVVISPQLAYTLGFHKQTVYRNQLAKYMPDITGGLRQFLVYAPKLVENSIIGDVTAPLIRVVNVTGKPGETVEDIYTSEHHHRILGRRHSEITIELRTLSGKLVKFHWGNCLLTLHFQRALF